MNEEDNISNIPKLQKLKKDISVFKIFYMVWPTLRPLAKMLGVDVEGIDEQLKQVPELSRSFDEMILIPDQFNNLFGDLGWILSENSLDLEVAQQAVFIAESQGIDAAEQLLVDHFSPEWVEKRISLLKFIQGFTPRFDLAMKALEDYKAGRYYASVLVVLSLIDGWVNDLNIVDHQRKGFFNSETKLIAYNSMTAHSRGLVKLKEVFGISRKKTQTEEISIPYRNGIMHGMDLGYDNRIVAAKCWAALFAVRDWAIKAARNELDPPDEEALEDKSLLESIRDYQKVRAETESFKKWKPRDRVIGRDIPTFASSQDYEENSPERKMIEFCELWQEKNYGYLAARAFSPFMCKKPGEVRKQFSSMELLEYRLTGIRDILPTIEDIDVWLKLIRNNHEVELEYTFRLICTDSNNEIVYLPREDTVWGVSTWWDKKEP